MREKVLDTNMTAIDSGGNGSLRTSTRYKDELIKRTTKKRKEEQIPEH